MDDCQKDRAELDGDPSHGDAVDDDDHCRGPFAATLRQLDEAEQRDRCEAGDPSSDPNLIHMIDRTGNSRQLNIEGEEQPKPVIRWPSSLVSDNNERKQQKRNTHKRNADEETEE